MPCTSISVSLLSHVTDGEAIGYVLQALGVQAGPADRVGVGDGASTDRWCMSAWKRQRGFDAVALGRNVGYGAGLSAAL